MFLVLWQLERCRHQAGRKLVKRALFSVAAAAAIGAIVSGWVYAPIAGQAQVIDGDTIAIGRQHIRLQGVDAPELRQPWGSESKAAMQAIVRDRKVVCWPDGTTSYDRVVAVCKIGDIDIGALLIQAGAASDCPRFSRGRYASYETNKALPHANYCGVSP